MKLQTLRAAICGMAFALLFASSATLAQTAGAVAGAAAGGAASGIAAIPASTIALGAVGVVAATAVLDDETATPATTPGSP